MRPAQALTLLAIGALAGGLTGAGAVTARTTPQRLDLAARLERAEAATRRLSAALERDREEDERRAEAFAALRDACNEALAAGEGEPLPVGRRQGRR
ncbi:MAG TPA: hypothetical protein VFS43_00265 [Polyangiaceae bacterium]|nr:hypothetical protein [Polyangiaceae bacterium]